MNKLHYYDQIVSLLVANLKDMSKNNSLSLGEFNPKDEDHLCLFSVAKILHDIYSIKLSVDINPIRLFFFKWKHNYWHIVTSCKKPARVNCPALVGFVEKANTKGVLGEIYREYYKK